MKDWTTDAGGNSADAATSAHPWNLGRPHQAGGDPQILHACAKHWVARANYHATCDGT
jgi:hypothetical protein